MRITSLTIHPIKSCRGVAVRQSAVVPGGLRYDRRIMLVDEAGKMMTARKVPELLLVHTAIDGGRLSVDESLDLPLEPTPNELDEPLTVSVWKDSPVARVHQEGSAWFTRKLGRAVRLVFLPEPQLRQVHPARSRPGDVVSFADAFPLLVTNQASLDELNRRLPERIGMERFRPNVVVEGGSPFDEDTWKGLSLGALPGNIPKLCDRCVMTTVDPQTGQRGKEPLKTLAGFRRWDGAVWFGANFIPHQAALPATLRVGDEVRVTERRPHPQG